MRSSHSTHYGALDHTSERGGRRLRLRGCYCEQHIFALISRDQCRGKLYSCMYGRGLSSHSGQHADHTPTGPGAGTAVWLRLWVRSFKGGAPELWLTTGGELFLAGVSTLP